MTDQQNQNVYGQPRPGGPPQMHGGMNGDQNGPNNMQWKAGPPVHNGQFQPGHVSQPNINGLPHQPNPSQGAPPSSMPGPPMMNGPSSRPPLGMNTQMTRPMNPQMNRPALSPSTQGPFRPVGPPQGQMRPGMGPPGQPRMPQVVPPMSTSHLGQERPNDLPVPFHGHGQYSRQVHTSLTPGITPTNSGPPSQKSSRGNSPAVPGQNFDALEGQFNDPTSPSDGSLPRVPSSQWGPGGDQGITPPGGINTGAGQRFGAPGTPGESNTPPQQPGNPRFPPPNQFGAGQGPQQGAPQSNVPGQGSMPNSFPGQRPGFPPQPGQVGLPPRPGFPPMPPTLVGQTQPGFTPTSNQGQRPGFPPSTQPAGQPPMFPPGPVSSNQQVRPTPPHQQPGFPPPPSTNNQQPGFPPPISANQQPGFPPQPSSANQQPGFPPPPMSTNQQPGFPPQPVSANQQPGFPPQPISANQQPGFPPQPMSANQQPGFPPPPMSTNQQPGFPPQRFPPPNSTSQQPGFPPPPMSNSQQPGFPPQTGSNNQVPGFPPPPTNNQPRGPVPGQQPGFTPPSGPGQHPRYPQPPTSNFGQNQPGGAGPRPQFNTQTGKSVGEFVNSYPNTAPLATSLGSMSLQGGQNLNLLQQKVLIPPEGVKIPKPVIPNDQRMVNCNPEVFRCTLNSIPQTSALLNKARLPLGILIHPFKDLAQLPVIQSSVIVRCRKCRTYINPYVYFVDSRRWKCNLCFCVNELPDEFSFDPSSKTYGDPQRRPEIKSATIEFIAPSEYMLRPPQPAVYLYLLDVSFNAVETGYLNMLCETLLDVMDRIPGDSRTQIGFIAYDSAVHFFNLAEGLSQPQMMTVGDVDDIFLPCPDDLLVNLHACKTQVTELLNQLPTLFQGNMETRSALGPALQAAYKMMSGTGGRVTVMQTILPSAGPGALQNREDATEKSGKDSQNLGPATDFYKKLALDCSAQQIAVDVFMLNGQYADLASIACISKYSAGCVYYYPSYHSVRAPHLVEKFEVDLRRYLTRKIGFESVMRIRCTRGISIHTFHGNFFVRSTDLLSLPNVNPDAGFGMQMSIEDSLVESSTMCFQAALLYTSSKGERRIRVHTLCLPITNQLSDIYANADQQAIIDLVSKMAVDRSISSSLSDAREAIVNAAIDTLNAYGSTIPSGQRMGSLAINDPLRLMPLYCLSLLKSVAFRSGTPTKLDDRVYALEQCKTLPTVQLIQLLYPHLYPVHTIMEVELLKKFNSEVPNLPLLQLSSANIDRHGAYILDVGEKVYLYIGSAINEQFCSDILGVSSYRDIQEGGIRDLPELDNEGSERLRSFMTYLMDSRSNGISLFIVRDDGKYRLPFFQHFVEDRTESSLSYYEFLQHIQKQVKS